MAAGPKLLLLDEPTSRLDPISARRFLDVLRRLREELGVTVVLAEHRLEEVFSLADTVLTLDAGRLVSALPPRAAALSLSSSPLSSALPAAARLWAALGKEGEAPLTVPEGRDFVRRFTGGEAPAAAFPPADETPAGDVLLEGKNLTFAFKKNADPVVDGVSLSLFAGEHLCLLGPNGAGKSTLLRILAGVLPALGGKVRLFGRELKTYKRGEQYKNGIAMLPQEPGAVFLRATVLEDFLSVLPELSKEDAEKKARALAEKTGVAHLLNVNPLDLSGGETQLSALTKLLLTSPRVLLLDEPTKGLDPEKKAVLAAIIRSCLAEGNAVLTVTHDADFAAETATRCAFLFRGELLAEAMPAHFFRDNAFYTTTTARMVPGAITTEAAAKTVSAKRKDKR